MVVLVDDDIFFLLILRKKTDELVIDVVLLLVASQILWGVWVVCGWAAMRTYIGAAEQVRHTRRSASLTNSREL